MSGSPKVTGSATHRGSYWDDSESMHLYCIIGFEIKNKTKVHGFVFRAWLLLLATLVCGN